MKKTSILRGFKIPIVILMDTDYITATCFLANTCTPVYAKKNRSPPSCIITKLADCTGFTRVKHGVNIEKQLVKKVNY